MSSLSTRAGNRRPENFHQESSEYTKFHYSLKINDVFQYYAGLLRLRTDYTTDIYEGRDIRDFHKRKSAGELLPYTKYTKVTHSLSTSGKRAWTYVSPITGDRFDAEYVPVSTGHNGRSFLLDGGSRQSPSDGGNPLDFGLTNVANADIKEAGIDPSYLVQAAAVKLYTRGFDAGTFLAELHKTIALLGSAARRFTKILGDADQQMGKYLKKGYKRHNHADVLLQQWLEARYGWRLLLYDIQDINHLIANFDKKARTRNKERVGMQTTLVDDRSYTKTTGLGTHTYSDIRNVDINVRGSIISDFIPSRIRWNLVTTGWEVAPYSFVVDWFFNIGAALNAMSFLLLNDQYTASVGIGVSCSREGSYNMDSWETDYSGAITQTVDQNWEVRQRIPVPVSYIPHYNNRLDIPKGIDIIALMNAFVTTGLRHLHIR